MNDVDINCPDDLLKWGQGVLAELNGPDAALYHNDRWITYSRDAISYARALGLAAAVQPFDQPIPYPEYAVDYDSIGRVIREELRERIDKLLQNLTGNVAEGRTPRELPIVRAHGTNDFVLWEAVLYPLTPNEADLWRELLKAKGQPVGAGKILGDKAARWYGNLPEPLQKVVAKADGNKGYRLTLFD